MEQAHLKHLLSRATFGMSIKHWQTYKNWSRSEVVEDLFKQSKSLTPFQLDQSEFIKLVEQRGMRDKKALQAFIRDSRKKFLELNNQWFFNLTSAPEELRERMVLFWINHFVCKDNNVYFMQQYLNSIKQHALGDFGDFLKAVSKEAAMLKYLNGRQNRKASPNENFARELLELFTLGEGQYTEKDIKECARAFTGYSHNFQGDFVLRRFQHDFGRKVVLGQSGAFDGDDIIDIILQQKQCAKFICSKIYSYFVNPVPNAAHIHELTVVFYQNYDIAELLKYLFLQDWFYDDTNVGVKIKSPADLLANAYRIWPYEFVDDKAYFKIQKLLGQSLLDPPNVAGWPGDKAWIDTNTLLLRLKLPSLIYGVHLQSAEVFTNRGRRRNHPFVANVQRQYLETHYSQRTNRELESFILSHPVSNGLISEATTASVKAQTVVQLMSLPEFQLA